MRSFAACLVCLLAPAFSLAQKMDDFDFHFADMKIIQAKAVQTEIALTQPQRNAMNKHAEWLDIQKASLGKLVQDKKLSPEEATKQLNQAFAVLKQKVLGELTPAQLRRVREITLQRDGLLPLLNQKVADKIGLTTSQLGAIRDGFAKNDEAAKKLQLKVLEPIVKKYETMKPKNKQEADTLIAQRDKEMNSAIKPLEPELEKLANNYEEFIKKTLSKGQFDAFIALKGKPFKPAS